MSPVCCNETPGVAGLLPETGHGVRGTVSRELPKHETRTFSHEAFRLPQDLETTFITLDLGDAERVLALIAVGDAAIDWDQPRAGIVLEVASVAATLREADVRGLACLPIKREPNPEQGPPRSEGGFYDPDGNPIVVYDLSP